MLVDYATHERVLTDRPLAKNPETVAFAKEYTAALEDDDDEFAHLRNEGTLMDLDGDAGEEEQQSDDEPPQIISAAQLREELRAQAAMPVSSALCVGLHGCLIAASRRSHSTSTMWGTWTRTTRMKRSLG